MKEGLTRSRARDARGQREQRPPPRAADPSDPVRLQQSHNRINYRLCLLTLLRISTLSITL